MIVRLRSEYQNSNGSSALIFTVRYDPDTQTVEEITGIETLKHHTMTFCDVTDQFLKNFCDEIYALVEKINWEEVYSEYAHGESDFKDNGNDKYLDKTIDALGLNIAKLEATIRRI